MSVGRGRLAEGKGHETDPRGRWVDDGKGVSGVVDIVKRVGRGVDNVTGSKGVGRGVDDVNRTTHMVVVYNGDVSRWVRVSRRVDDMGVLLQARDTAR